jgi:putative hydrolase of the HAD superfamily
MIVLFDLDGTLCDHAGADRAAALALRAALAPDMSETAFLAEWRAAQMRHYARYLDGDISFPEQRRARVRAVAGAALIDAEADLAFNVYFSAYREAWRLFDDVRPCLAALSGMALGVVTNGDGAVQRRKIEALGLADSFAAVVVSGEVGFAKPDPRIFALACARLGAAPGQALFIGDERETDAEAARAAGLRGLWLDRADRRPSAPDRLTSLREIPPLLAAAG